MSMKLEKNNSDIRHSKKKINNLVDLNKNESDVNENESDVNENESETKKLDEIVIGIDLGTRFSCVSVWRNKCFEIICDQFGNRTIPSVVAFYRSAKLVGHNALSMKEVDPSNTIYDIKRIIGRKINDSINSTNYEN